MLDLRAADSLIKADDCLVWAAHLSVIEQPRFGGLTSKRLSSTVDFVRVALKAWHRVRNVVLSARPCAWNKQNIMMVIAKRSAFQENVS